MTGPRDVSWRDDIERPGYELDEGEHAPIVYCCDRRCKILLSELSWYRVQTRCIKHIRAECDHLLGREGILLERGSICSCQVR